MNPLHDALFGRHAGRDTPFLILPDGQVLSHAGFLARAARFAGEIVALGLKPGDRLAAQIEKSPDALAVYAACVQVGVVFLPLNTAYTAAEIGYFVTDSGARLFLCDPAREAAMAPVAGAASPKPPPPGPARSRPCREAWAIWRRCSTRRARPGARRGRC